jgi:acylphosphatase
VRGRVQGVGFRYFVMDRARSLRLLGFARNLADGSVEVQAQGDPGSLEGLVLALQEGPPLSRVDGVEEQGIDPDPMWTDFRITF